MSKPQTKTRGAGGEVHNFEMEHFASSLFHMKKFKTNSFASFQIPKLIEREQHDVEQAG